MKTVWLWLLIGSAAGLAFVSLRSRIGWAWLGTVSLQLVIAGALLYAVGLAAPYTQLHIPINITTMAVVAALGVPGLAMLAGLKLLVV